MTLFSLRSIILACAGVCASGCADPFGGLSAEPAPAAAKIDQLVAALTARFTNVDRSGRFELARGRMILSALTPGKLLADTGIWTSASSPTTRALAAKGSLVGNGYRFEIAPGAAPALTLGDTRHLISLTKLRDNEFRWETAVDFAVGSMTANDVASAFNAMLAVPEGRTGSEIRGDGRRLFPSTAAALSRAIVVDSLDVRPGAQQTTLVYLRLALMTDRLRAVYPAFGAYLAKYSKRSHSRFVLGDAAGRTYFDAEGGADRWVIRYRLSNGALVSSVGPPRSMPDTLQLTADLTLRTALFTVGFRNLKTEFIIDSSARERGWTVVARREPEWVLPLLTEELIGSSLRRPFQANGAMFQLAVRDSGRAPTLLVRRGRLEVQESTMMRVLNGFVAKMFNDLNPNVEREESAFLHDMLVAFGHDAHALPSLSVQKKGNATGP